MGIIAWAVAVERFDGPELNICQPIGLWAIEFAEIFVRSNATKIVLSASFSLEEQYRPRLEQLEKFGVRRTGATQAAIQNVLQELQGGDALMLYWVGHGIMSPSRQLLCSDSTKATELRCISIESLLRHLRASTYAPMQMGFFECCAQVVTSSPASLDLGGEGRTARNQYFYYAASAAEIASASTARPGFSRTILNNLASAGTLPPQRPDDFFSLLRSAFRSLPLPTRPTHMVYTVGSGDGDAWSIDAADEKQRIEDAVCLSKLTSSQFQRLWRHAAKAGGSPVEFATAILADRIADFVARFRDAQLESAEPGLLERAAEELRIEREFEPLCLELRLSWREWVALYNRLANEQWLSTASPPGELSAVLLNVLDQANHIKRLEDFATLLARAARRSSNVLASAALRNYMQSHPAIGPVYGSVAAQMAVNELFLMLDLEWEPNTKTASLKQAWIHPGLDGHYETREVPENATLAVQVNAVLQNVLAEYPECRIYLELMCPNELLGMPVQLLKLTDPELEISVSLESRYPVAVRWKARVQNKNHMYRGVWIQRSRTVQQSGSAAALLCRWMPPVDDVHNHHVLALAFPGPNPEHPGRNKALFFNELVKGDPYMCWPRDEPADTNRFRNICTEFFGSVSYDQLPMALCDRRGDPVLTDLVLLIDLPGRDPYPIKPSLTETGQRNTT